MAHILVPTDFSDAAALAYPYAIAEAERRGNARISLVTVLEDVVPATVQFEFGLTFLDPSSLMNEAGDRAKERLIEIAAKHFREMEVSTVVITSTGACWGEIVEYAKSQRADLIVTTTHCRTGLKHLVLGSVTEQIIRSAPCPVLVIPIPSALAEATPANEASSSE